MGLEVRQKAAGRCRKLSFDSWTSLRAVVCNHVCCTVQSPGCYSSWAGTAVVTSSRQRAVCEPKKGTCLSFIKTQANFRDTRSERRLEVQLWKMLPSLFERLWHLPRGSSATLSPLMWPSSPSPQSSIGTKKAPGYHSINSLFIGGLADNNLKN